MQLKPATELQINKKCLNVSSLFIGKEYKMDDLITAVTYMWFWCIHNFAKL